MPEDGRCGPLCYSTILYITSEGESLSGLQVVQVVVVGVGFEFEWVLAVCFGVVAGLEQELDVPEDVYQVERDIPQFLHLGRVYLFVIDYLFAHLDVVFHVRLVFLAYE